MNISWLFEIGSYRFSTQAVSFSSVDYTAKVIPESFHGIREGWDITGNSLIYPSDLEFELHNADGALTREDLEGQPCTIKLITDGALCRTWRFEVQAAVLSYGKIRVYCVGLLQKYLTGDYPNTPHPREVWVSANHQPEDGVYDDYRIPVIFGTAYIPLMYVYHTVDETGYYVLGEDQGYNIQEIKAPPESSSLIWDSGGYAFSQTSDAGYRLAEFAIAPTETPGVYTEGTWPSGQKPLAKYSKTTGSTTAPGEILSNVLQDFGVPVSDIDTSGSWAAADTLFVTQGIAWNGGFYQAQDRERILAELLTQCDGIISGTDKIELRQFSRTIQETFTTAKTKALSYSPSRITQSVSDSGHVAWAPSGTPQNVLAGKALVPVDSSTDHPDKTTFECRFINSDIVAQKLGILHFQRKLAGRDSISFSTAGPVMETLGTLRAGDVITVDDPILGGEQDIIVSQLEILPDLTVQISGRSYSILQEFGDLSVSPVTVPDDTVNPLLGGSDAVYISGPTVFKYPAGQDVPETTPIILTATLYGDLTEYDWEYWDGAAWADLSGTQDQSTYSLAHDNAAWGTDTTLRIRCVSGAVVAERTISKLHDGVDGADGAAGTPGVDATNWNSSILFTASDHNTVTWATGHVYTAGNDFTIDAGTTNNMTVGDTYYIYLKPSVSTTALQVTTTASAAVGPEQILVAAAFANANTSSQAGFQSFGGGGGVFVVADNIAARSIAGDHAVLNTFTSAHIQVSTLLISNLGGAGELAEEDYVDLRYDVLNKSLANLDATANTKLAGIAAGADVTGSNTALDTTRVNGLPSATLIVDGFVGTGLVIANSMHADGISTCKFRCSDSNDNSGFTTYRGYATTGTATIAFGGRNTHSTAISAGIYGRADSSNTSAMGVQGYCSSGRGVRGESSSGQGVYGLATTGQGVWGRSGGHGVRGETTDSSGYWGLITYQKCYAQDGYSPFTGSHLGFSTQQPEIGDIVCAEGAIMISVNESFPFLATAVSQQDKSVIGVVAEIQDKSDLINSGSLGHIKEDCRFYDKIPINERTIISAEDVPGHDIKKGDAYQINDGYAYVPKSEFQTKNLKSAGRPSTIVDVIESQEYYVVEINALGEGGINVCSEGGDIEIGDYICSASVPGKGMRQADDVLHNYTVAKSLERVTWGKGEENQIRMIACTYHCG